MRLGRAGVIAAANRKKRDEQGKRQVLESQQRAREIQLSDRYSNRDQESGNNEDGSVISGSTPHDFSSGVVVNIQDNINLKERSSERLIFRKFPFTLWAVGSVVILSSIYLIYHLAFATWGVLFEGYQEGHWWQYAVAVFILILGFIFLNSGRIESVVIDKTTSLLEVISTSIFCTTRKRVDDLHQVHNIRGIKKGHEGINFYTIHYVIVAEFRNKPSVKIMESQNRRKIIKQLVMVRNFLGLFCTEDEVHILDQSTRI